MTERVSEAAVKDLFEKLARIEINHQERVLSEYRKVTETNPSKDEFEQPPLSSPGA